MAAEVGVTVASGVGEATGFGVTVTGVIWTKAGAGVADGIVSGNIKYKWKEYGVETTRRQSQLDRADDRDSTDGPCAH